MYESCHTSGSKQKQENGTDSGVKICKESSHANNVAGSLRHHDIFHCVQKKFVFKFVDPHCSELFVRNSYVLKGI